MKMNDAELMILVEKYISDLAGGDVLNSIKIHANIAAVNTKHVLFQGSDRGVVYNVFKAAHSQNKLDNLLRTIREDDKNLRNASLFMQPKLVINDWASYVFIGNTFSDSYYDLVSGYVENPVSASKRTIVKISITGSNQESFVSMNLPGNSKVEIPKLQIPRFTQDELSLITHSISPATIFIKLFLAGEDSLIDVFQAQTLISQPDFVLIARELKDGTIEDHSQILSWLVNSGAKGINNFIEAKVMPQIGKVSGYQSDNRYSASEIKDFPRKQAMAVYDGLKDLKLNYIPTELLVTNHEEKMILQRVQNPDGILLGTSTYINCLDGVILFSSIIERLNLDPIIVLMPGHSIVGWKGNPAVDTKKVGELFSTCEFLDVTLASDSLDFYSAVSAAEAYMIRYLPLFESEPKKIEEYVKIIDVKLSRKILS